MNPAAVIGPLLGPDVGPSLLLPLRLLRGELKGCPKFAFPFVDVRDVAALHVLAMTRPEAKGERFIASWGPSLSVLDISKIMHARLGPLAAKAPLRELPNWLLRAMAPFVPQVRAILPQLGKSFATSSGKAQQLLGWNARSNEDAIVDTAESFVRFGLLARAS